MWEENIQIYNKNNLYHMKAKKKKKKRVWIRLSASIYYMKNLPYIISKTHKVHTQSQRQWHRHCRQNPQPESLQFSYTQ